jgi:hypothetical protein
MQTNTFSSWLFNVMLWGAVVWLLILSYHVYVGPVLGSLTAVAAFVFIAVVSAFWPKY